jgi:hypothetical protein
VHRNCSWRRLGAAARPLGSFLAAGLLVVGVPAIPASGQTTGKSPEPALARLVAAYPNFLDRLEGTTLIWRDGTRMETDDGTGAKPFEAWLERPDIEDMLQQHYPTGAEPLPPPTNFDPGRARNSAFFDKMYGDCRKGGVVPHLRPVVWLPKKGKQRLLVTGANGVDAKLAAVSAELDELPSTFDPFLVPAAGTYNCRVIAGTSRTSAHGYGIAIDIAVSRSDYWRWSGPTASGGIHYKNRIPMEIVRVFEKHGFIWGGRWSHYDTMHFEYRPELMPTGAGG